MLPTALRSSKLLLLVTVFTLAILWSCRLPRLCIFNQCPQLSSSSSSPPPTNPGSRTAADTSEVVDLSLADAPFVAWPLARLCAETSTWTPALVFVCDNNSGGIGNIRNFILTCLRYAIEAGATGLTMPTIQTRDGDRLAELWRGQKVAFDYFFDEGHFRRSLAGACPRITLYDGLDDVPGFSSDGQKVEGGGGPPRQPWEMLTPNTLGQRGGCDQRDLNRHVDVFGARFHAWLSARQEKLGQRPGGVVSAAETTPRFVRFNWGVQWTFPVYRDGPEFVATFGGLLRFRADVLELGREVVDALGEEGQGGFVGMHLRTENDALSGWPGFEEQSGAYLERVSLLRPGGGPRVVYLATGNATEAAKLAARGEEAGLTVVTKHGLLAAPEHAELRARLDALSWDQQALVDFVVLLRAEYFLGVSPSSFSMNVALKRHLKGDGLYTRPWRVGVEEGDGWSWLVGRYEAYWEDWLFMYDSLWP